MAEKKQFFRDIQPGDVSIEGRQSNGITAKSDGSVILYSGVKDNELDSLQNYNGNVPIDGYLGNIIAVLKADQGVAFPIGNNNEETYIESPNVDPNKIIIAANITITPTPTPLPTGTITPTPTPTPTLPTTEDTPPDPAIEFLPETEFAQASAQIFDEIDYYRNIEVIDGSLWVYTAGYSIQFQALYNSEKSGVSTKTKSGKEVIIAAKAMIDKAIAKYPMIADKSKYPDAMNRLLAFLLVAYNEARFTPQNENPNHTYNTAKRAKLRKVYSLTLDQFYNKFGVKAGQESKRASGDAQTADPPAIFKYAYADYNGNGDEASGDGYKFRGRGYYGITFKNGYKEIGKVMYGDENKFITDPDSINVEPDATNAFLTSMFEGGLCALKVGLLAYTTTPANVNGFNIGALVDVTLPNGTKKKIRGDLASNYTTFRGANNLVNGYTAQGYVDNFSNIFNSQELRDYINSKLK
jgi:putative chitinase